MSDDLDAGATPAQPEGVTPASLAERLAAWFAEWYPDPAPGSHPAPPYSGAWHHARAALADLETRLGL